MSRILQVVLSRIRPNKIFSIPNWIPRFPNPRKSFDLNPPTYQEVTRVIRKMKSSGSPCSLDQISVIPFKHCPYLRSYRTELISVVWRQGSVPHEWKRAVTILLHKKGDTSDPANFRPITLESIPLKIFTSCLRNKIYNFLKGNEMIEHSIQKGFTPGISGTYEHTPHMVPLDKYCSSRAVISCNYIN